MPVRELSERVRINRLGKIRLGEKEPNSSGNGEHPVARDYFVIPDELKPALGDKPTELKIAFPSDDLEEIASQYYRSYNASHGRICKGDGYKADAMLDADELKKRGGDVTAPMNIDLWAHGATRGRKKTENVVMQQIECLGVGYDGRPPCPLYAQKDCGIKMFLQAYVIGAPGLGVYQIDTGSVIGIQNVNGALAMTKRLTNGRIAGIPFLLKRVKTEVAPPPEMRKKTISTITLEVDPSIQPGRLLAAAEAPLINALLPPPDESDAAEAFGDEETIEGEATVIAHPAATPSERAGGLADQTSAPASPTASAPKPKTATREQGAAIREWQEQVKEKRGVEAINTVGAWAVVAFPYATARRGYFVMEDLTSDDADKLIEVLKASFETGALPPAVAVSP